MRPRAQFIISLFFLLIFHQLVGQKPLLSVQILAGPTGYLMFDETYYKASKKFNYSAGVYVAANLPIRESRLSFRSGYFVNTKKYTREYRPSNSLTDKIVETSYVYGNIPLLIEAGFNTRRNISPYISAGLILGTILDAEQRNEKGNGTVTEGFPSDSYNKQNQTDFYACAGANFRINSVLLIHTELYMSQQLDKDEGKNQDRFGYFSYGITIGLQIDMFMLDEKKE